MMIRVWHRYSSLFYFRNVADRLRFLFNLAKLIFQSINHAWRGAITGNILRHRTAASHFPQRIISSTPNLLYKEIWPVDRRASPSYFLGDRSECEG
ncbi:hypothetical protein GZH79_13480 [Loktanella sp. SALINAS62]|nr:hypothetical protein [Loktanella sp. SALINAS62]